jgi:ribose-phosphate pyrophosphokinase
MTAEKNINVFSGSTGRNFARRICEYLGISLGSSGLITFSEGNLLVKIKENVRGRDVFLVQPVGLGPNNELVEMLFWLDAFKLASVNSVTAVIQYFGYAKGDKKDEPRVSLRARVCAESLELAGADRIITMDLHSPQIQGFFKVPVDHLSALLLFVEYIKRCNPGELVVVSPDSGYAKRARKFATALNASLAIADKVRKAHDENPEVTDIIGEVAGKDVLMVDDFTISGNTLVNLARELKKRGHAGQSC